MMLPTTLDGLPKLGARQAATPARQKEPRRRHGTSAAPADPRRQSPVAPTELVMEKAKNQMERLLQGDALAERVISAISFARDVMGKNHAHIASVSSHWRYQSYGSSRMVAFGLVCEYMRERKKRGKVSRRDLQQQQAAAAAPADSDSASHKAVHPQPAASAPESPLDIHFGQIQVSGGLPLDHTPAHISDLPLPHLEITVPGHHGFLNEHSGVMNCTQAPYGMHTSVPTVQVPRSLTESSQSWTPTCVDGSSTRSDRSASLTDYEFSDMEIHPNCHPPAYWAIGTPQSADGLLHDQGEAAAYVHDGSELTRLGQPVSGAPFHVYSPDSRIGHDLRPGQLNIQTPMSSPLDPSLSPWSSERFSSSSPGTGFSSHPFRGDPIRSLRYPVLQPLVPHLETFLSLNVACDLLDSYFANFTYASVHPLSPYLLGHVFRKRSFLHPTQPRVCRPALLASMLWIAAGARGKGFRPSFDAEQEHVCQQLLELTLRLLQPGIGHISRSGVPEALMTAPGATGEGLYPGGHMLSAQQVTTGPYGAGEPSPACPPAALDDVATCINLAVISAIECPSRSLPWWNAAWNLAKGMKLNQEVHYQMMKSTEFGNGVAEMKLESDALLQPRSRSTSNTAGANTIGQSIPKGPYAASKSLISDEEREERRRVWWLLYILDRDLALCCDRPLAISNAECAELLRPMDESTWQDGEMGECRPEAGGPEPRSDPRHHHNVQGIFGKYLPLMTMVGEVIRLKAAGDGALAGLDLRPLTDWVSPYPSPAPHVQLKSGMHSPFDTPQVSIDGVV